MPALPPQGTGPDVLGRLCRRTGSLFYCRALDVPFTDKGIQACRLKGSTAASGQSAVRRHTRARGTVVVVVVVVVVICDLLVVSIDFCSHFDVCLHWFVEFISAGIFGFL